MRSALTDSPVASFTTRHLRARQHATGLMMKVALLLPSRGLLSSQQQLRWTHTIGIAAKLAGHWSNGHFIAVVLHLGWTNNAGLLFVNFYFFIFNHQRFRAGQAMNAAPAAIPVR